MKTVLTNCTVIDGTGQPPRKDMSLVIEGDRIIELKAGKYGPPAGEGERVLDLEGGYVLPGLWNVHVHLGDLIPDPQFLLETESPIDYAIRAGRNAMDALRAGIMGIRIVGEDHYADFAWKRAFDAGVFVGPRIFACGRAISITGGHGHGTLGALEVDGPFEMRKAVREQLKQGADQIKLMVTGGVMTAGEGMEESQFLLDEILAATEVAHQKGRRVCVHAWGAAGIKTAIQGGVDTVEHGLLDDEIIEMMVERGVFYVPTLNCTQDKEKILEGGLPDFMVEKALGAAEAHLEGFQKALGAGVKIACGADTSPVTDFTLLEIEHLVRAGMSEMEALVAATRTSADLCGVVDRLGTVEVGKLADLIVLLADPLEDISNARKLKLVLKAGRLVDIKPQEGQADFWELFF
ncbi:MAG: amidohydrolase family protein [Anaerolineae bacterium]|nr:amidohydrolase family protein [Anaerolineae bacterium]NIN95869.1 amidohydrolase family protein [Anaerolineae bacterium]NIQ78836.1 amidohydrolase family protein [Anaerolineae bacterium]